MPSSAQILTGLAAITNDWQSLAVLWHIYFAIIAISLIIGIRPPKKVVGVLLALPLLSVSALAWVSANPFNGLAFAVVGFALIVLSMRLAGHIKIAPIGLTAVGGVIFVFGWLYPHFLSAESPSAYLFAAPTGLIPCPTLSVVIGVGLIVNGMDSRAWAFLLAIAGIFYGFFGAITLGVSLDWILAVAAITILIVGVRSRPATTELTD